MRKTLPVVIVVLFGCAHSQAQSPAVLTAADLGAQPDPAIPAFPPQAGIGGNPQAPRGPVPFGNGEQPVLRFAGENGPQNLFTFSLFDDTGYDDNLFATNINKIGAFFTSVGPRVSFLTSRKHMTFDFDYAPSFEIFKQNSARDAVNQILALDVAAEMSPRFQLRMRESASELYYGLFGGNGEQLVPGLGPPGGSVPYFINPGSRTIDSASRVDLVFNKSARTSIDVFGGYSLMDIKNPGVNITYGNVRSPNAGWSYSYRVSARGSFSATYLYAQSQFASAATRYSNQNLSLSYAYQISNTASVSVFGGPEYTYINETLLIPIQTIFGIIDLPYPIHKPEWDWSGGFSATKTTLGTAFSLFGSRYVASGGGLLTALNSNSGSLVVSRRLPWNWTGSMALTYSQFQALSFGQAQTGKYTIAGGSISLNHRLGERASVRMNYARTRQRGSAATLSAAVGPGLDYGNMDRNRASIGIDWQIGKVHLGH